jgi:hypothetical protein
MQDSEVKQMFEVFGQVASLSIRSNKLGEFGVVQYGGEDQTKEQSAICARNALINLKDTVFPDGSILYVRNFRDKFQRDEETFTFAQKYVDWFQKRKNNCMLLQPSFSDLETEASS